MAFGIYISISDHLASSLRRRAEMRLAERGWFRIFDEPPADECVIPFVRVIGSLREFSAGLISSQDLARALRKASKEIISGS